MAYATHIPPKEGVIDAAADTIDRPPVERTHFRALLATNPNYFGNLVTPMTMARHGPISAMPVSRSMIFRPA